MLKKLNAIVVKAKSSYLPEQSDPSHQKFVWSYDITISNDSDEIIQLLKRCWHITDTTGKVEEIHGAGVIGLQPIIKPKRQFIYTSYCQLLTPQGTMEGYYEMQTLDEELFEVDIPKFVLSAPATVTQPFRSKLH